MAQAVDEAGNLWETDAAGNPVRFIGRAPSGPTTLGTPDPYKSASEAREQTRLDLAREAGERAQRAEGRAAAAEARAAEREARLSRPPMRTGDAQQLEEQLSAYSYLKNSLGNFQDDFAGNTLFGETENILQGALGVGTPGQRDWWANFRTADNLIRNALFGASLTSGEKQAYNATTVTPRMTPNEVRENLKRRVGIAQDALTRRVNRLKTVYNKDEIDAAVGDLGVDFGIKPAAEQLPPKIERDETAILPGGRPRIDPGEGAFGDQPQGPQGSPRLSSQDEAGYRRFLTSNKGRLSPEMINAWWAGKGFPNGVSNAAEVARAVNTGMQIGGISYAAPDAAYNAALDERNRRLAEFGQESGLLSRAASGTGIADEIAGLTAGLTGPGTFAEDYAFARDAEQRRLDQMRATQGIPGYLAEIGGAAVASLPLVGAGEAALARTIPNIASPFARTLAAETAFGGGYGAATAEPGSRLSGALTGAPAAALGTIGGTALAKGVGGMFAGTARAPRSRALAEFGAPPTTGGILRERGGLVGRIAGGLEDRLAGFTGIGDVIGARRQEALEGLNLGSINRAIQDIPGRVTELGRGGIAQAEDAAAAAYNASLAPMRLQADPQFAEALNNARKARLKVADTLRGVVDASYENNIRPFIGPNGEITGEGLQAIKQGLDLDIASLKNVPGGKAARDNLRQAKDAVFNLAERQQPDLYQGYRAADEAFKNVQIVKKASEAASGKPGDPGLFTPAQLATQAKRSAAKYGPNPFTDIAESAVGVLPSQVPDSGTAGRLAAGLALGGIAGGAGYFTDPATGALIAATALPFTKVGQRIGRAALIGQRGPTTQAIGEGIKRRRMFGGMVGAPLGLEYATVNSQN